MTLTGGCQCGSVRFALGAEPRDVHLCHCRMCQKAVGGPFAVVCPVPRSMVRLTRGDFASFQSSDAARRGFCRNCGTPLAFDMGSEDGFALLAGAFDRPDLVPPVMQCGREHGVPWVAGLEELPLTALHPDEPAMLGRIKATSRQHPDHETELWPPG